MVVKFIALFNGGHIFGPFITVDRRENILLDKLVANESLSTPELVNSFICDLGP